MNSFKNVPLTIYDFLGYLFPGIVFWSLILFTPDLSVVFYPEKQNPKTTKTIAKDGKATQPLLKRKELLFTEASQLIKEKSWALILAIFVGLYITGHVNSVISRQLFERWIAGGLLGLPSSHILGETPKNLGSRVISFAFRFFRNNYLSTYSEEIRKCYIENYKDIFDIEIATEKSIQESFAIADEYICLNSPRSYGVALHFVNLYGFSRNLSATLLLVVIILGYLHCFGEIEIHSSFFIFYSLGSFLMYTNYLSLYRRYQDKVMRSFILHTQLSKKALKKEWTGVSEQE